MTSMILSTKGASPSVKSTLNDLTKITSNVKENMFDIKKSLSILESYMDNNGCTSILLFECTKRIEYLWTAKSDLSIKFTIHSLESIYDLSTTTNYHKGSGHVLLFTDDFEADPNLRLVKAMFEEVLASPEDAPIERVLSFFHVGGLIYLRHYLRDDLKEIGPRLTLGLDKVLEGCFRGTPIYQSKKELK